MNAPNELKPVTVGLVGCGFMGSMHAQVYRLLPNARVVAAADPRTEASTRKLRQLGWETPVYPSIVEMLQRHPEITVVDLCTPADLHEAGALMAIGAGKHVFCEKPLAPDLASADRIVAAVKKSGAFFQVGHCIRFWPEYQALRKFVAEGSAGRLLSLSLQRQAARPSYSADGWINDPRRSGGAAVDLHIHDADFVVALLGMPRRVHSRATFDAGGPSHIFTSYDFAGMIVTAEGGWNYPAQWGFRMAFDAVFESAAIEYDSQRSTALRITRSDRAPEPLPFEAPAAGSSQTGEGNLSSLGGYYNELRSFMADVAAGRPPAEATAEEAQASLALVWREIESARRGEALNV